MKFSQFTWNLYKESPQGQAVIESFTPECGSDCYDIAVKFNPHTTMVDKSLYADFSDSAYVWQSDNEKITSLSEAEAIFEHLIDRGMREEGDYFIEPKDYELVLAAISPLSFGLSASDDYFFPNLFQYNCYALKKLADNFELTLPDYPKKSDYRARCMYYWELCELFYKFRTDNGLSLAELCAFIYDFAPKIIGTDLQKPLPKPANAWFIGGVLQEEDKDYDFISSWQANSETKCGDILIQYETAPISAITSIRIATTDGIIDPFFHWYTWAHMSRYTSVSPITLNELRADPYFSVHPLIRKNFQGVNGWQLTSNDYIELLRIINEKGGDVSTLPQLYAPAAPNVGEIKYERDVEVKLLEYYLNEMGYIEGRDYRRQLPTPAGVGHRILPDYALHYDDTRNYEKARVVIEVKLKIHNNIDIEKHFTQAFSYAKLLESSVIVLCDKQKLFIYEKRDSFDRTNYSTYGWGELDNPDKFNELRNKLKK